MIRSTQQKQDNVLAKRFAFVVITDFLCWAPIVAAKIVGMAGKSVSLFNFIKNLIMNGEMSYE